MRTLILSIHLADEPGIPEGYLHNIKKDITDYLVQRGDATVLQVTAVSKDDYKAMVAASLEQVTAEAVILPPDAKVGYIPAVLPSEAVYGLIAFLASRSEAVTLSKRKDPSIAMSLANDFIQANGWEAARDGWEQSIEFPNIQQEINQRKTEMAQLLTTRRLREKEISADDPGTQDVKAIAAAGRIPELDNAQGSMFNEVMGSTNGRPPMIVEPADELAPQANAAAMAPEPDAVVEEEENPFL